MVIRRSFVWLHRWTGLLMASFLIVVGLTGTVLAFKLELERLINPQLFATPKPGQQALDLATLAERAEAQEPRARATYFQYVTPGFMIIPMSPRIDSATGKPYSLDFDHVFLNPYTGAEVGRRKDGDISQGRINLIPFIYKIHTSLALGNFGYWTLGVVALVWTLDCFVGFYLTLPAGKGNFWRNWKPAWLVKWRANKFRINFDLHRAVGLWFWPMLLVFAWSSVMFNLSPVYDKVTRAVFDYHSDLDVYSLPGMHTNDTPRLDWHAAQARGAQLMAEQAALRGFKVGAPVGMGFDPSVCVYFYDAHSTRDVMQRGWETTIWLDGDTGELRKMWLSTGEHSGNTVEIWLRAIHFADIHGWYAYRILVGVLGLLVVLLSISGIYIWWRKRRARNFSAQEKIHSSHVTAKPEGRL